MREGQAAWRDGGTAPEMTGELLVATHLNGATYVQFSKYPLPILTAQTTSNQWQIQFHLQNRTYAGTGQPPRRIVWLYLAHRLTGRPTPLSNAWTFQRIAGGAWRLANPSTGEFIAGFLTPGLPTTHTARTNETFESIAPNYGVELRDLRAANPGLNADGLSPGELVNLPVP